MTAFQKQLEKSGRGSSGGKAESSTPLHIFSTWVLPSHDNLPVAKLRYAWKSVHTVTFLTSIWSGNVNI